ncbi:STAS domain-containing protein [Nocardia sp. NBC_00511]|uniref:STAS domain-containing protein n=1 Tax=Nocardia sp. NBC_00511 TaxID=2903591 RepID=UPI0030E4C92E
MIMDVQGENTPEAASSRLLTVSSSRSGACVVVSVTGEIDITTADRLREALEPTGSDQRVPVVDLSGVEFMGSVGLSVLLALAARAEPERVRVVVSTPARRPIEITGLDQVLALFDTLDAALSHG